jgi:hypothetical protein
MPQVSLLATLLATVLSFVLGGLWYGPLFAKTWMKLIGVNEAPAGRIQAGQDLRHHVRTRVSHVVFILIGLSFALLG